MSTTGQVFRWVHMLSGGAWLGAVTMVVVVLVPSLRRLDEPRRAWFAGTVFPRVFRLASVLSVTVITTGALLYLERFDWQLRFSPLVDGRWGWSILIGSTLALLLAGFHFVAEGRLAPHVKGAVTTPIGQRVLTILRLAPRFGLAILVTVVVLMAYAARGL